MPSNHKPIEDENLKDKQTLSKNCWLEMEGEENQNYEIFFKQSA